MPTLLDVAREIKCTADVFAAAKARPRSEMFAEGELSAKLQKLFDDVTKQVLDNIAARGRVPSDEIMRRMVLQPFESSVDDLAGLASDDAVAAAQRGRNKVIDLLRQQGSSVTFDEMPQTVLNRVAESTFTASRQTMQRLVGDVKLSLEQGFSEGLGTKDIAKLLQDQFTSMRNFELNRVARTEVQSFQNVGAQQTMHDLGVTYEQWITAEDDRVRETHEAIHGEITSLDTPFSNGLRYPLDDAGPLEEWINCRCRAVPFIIPSGSAAPPFEPFTEGDLVPVKEA